MNIPRPPHRWSLAPRQAAAVQRRLAARVLVGPPSARPALVAGLDAAFSADGRLCIAAAVLWDVAAARVVEQRTATRPLVFPYVPGLLSFREAPALLAALRKLRTPPDALMCDGQGLAHPRRFGIASHLGVLCGLPSVGCAKSRLIGDHAPPPAPKGSHAPLLHHGDIVGSVLRTQDAVRPLFVSVGHRFDLPSARELVLACTTRYRLPEPTRLADILVAVEKRRLKAR